MSTPAGAPETEGLLQPFGYGVGYQDFIALTNPAAGANLQFVVDNRSWIRLLAARATITTSATVANRFVSLDYINARGTTFVRNAAGLVVTASTTNQVFEWNAGRTDAQWAANTPILGTLYSMFLPPGSTVQFTLDSIQAADQISSAQLTFERFDVGSVGYALGFVERDAVASSVDG